jgi:hypothetical protein
MATRKTIVLTLLTVAFTTPVLAQGAGGGAAGSGGAANAAPAASDTTTGMATSSGGINQNRNPAAQQTNTGDLVVSERSAVLQGKNTIAMPAESGVVSAPGVGVGHAANGVPIGNPGSGLGSPENSVGQTR